MALRITLPAEKITLVDPLALVFNSETFIRSGRRSVQLACGHWLITRNLNRAVCPRCKEMLRRSIEDGSEDYVGFRHGSRIDRMDWPNDPCRNLNQKR